MKIYKKLISAIYPYKCMGCGEIIDGEKSFCDLCEKQLERNNIQNLCLNCGYEKEDCVCNYNIYRFNKLICVFKNEGIVQRAYYKFKFNHIQHYVHFFANEMSDAVKLLYSDIKFDVICAVPSGQKGLNNTHYDHSGYIAESISKILEIPYLSDVLYCCKHKKSQHKSTIKERLSNVDGKYSFKKRIDGKTVLLVDDIRTTGATLDECSKMLLYAGASDVYCVTALATKTNFKKEN